MQPPIATEWPLTRGIIGTPSGNELAADAVLERFGLAEAIQDLAAQRQPIPGAPEIDYRHEVKYKNGADHGE